jgi:hypothetical protein
MKMDLSQHLPKLEKFEREQAAKPVRRSDNDPFVTVAIRSSVRARLRQEAAKRNMRFGDYLNSLLENGRRD